MNIKQLFCRHKYVKCDDGDKKIIGKYDFCLKCRKIKNFRLEEKEEEHKDSCIDDLVYEEDN